jgi:hypothetical protein
MFLVMHVKAMNLTGSTEATEKLNTLTVDASIL